MKKIALLLLPFLLTACARDLSQYVYGNEDPTQIGASFYIPEKNAKPPKEIPAESVGNLGLFDIPLGASPKDVLGFLPDPRGVYQGSMISLEGLPAIGFFSLNEAGKIKSVGLYLEDSEIKGSLQALLDKGYRPLFLNVENKQYVFSQIEAEQGKAKADAIVAKYLQNPAQYNYMALVLMPYADYTNMRITGVVPLLKATTVTFARAEVNVIFHNVLGAE